MISGYCLCDVLEAKTFKLPQSFRRSSRKNLLRVSDSNVAYLYSDNNFYIHVLSVIVILAVSSGL